MSEITTAQSHAEHYAEALGWGRVIPLPAERKVTPPKGTTGRTVDPEAADEAAAKAWESAPDNANVALVVPADLIAIDVDHYDDKHGVDTYEDLQYLYPELPDLDTMIRSSRRESGNLSGHYFFKVPEGIRWPKKAGDGLDILQPGHRYSVVYPSVFRDEDGDVLQYRWLKGLAEVDAPHVKDFPELPAEMVEELAIGGGLHGVAPVATNYEEAVEWVLENCHRPEGEPDEFTPTLTFEDGESRHDTAYEAIWNLIGHAQQFGRPGALTALQNMSAAFEEVLKGEQDRNPDQEFAEMLTDVVGKIRAQLASGDRAPRDWSILDELEGFTGLDTLKPDPLEGVEPVVEVGPEAARADKIKALEEAYARKHGDFWSSSPVLEAVADYAERSSTEKYSLLFRVLSRLAAKMDPQTYLKDFRQPLTTYSVVIAPTGAGKGVLDATSERMTALKKDEPKLIERGTGNIHTLLTELGDFDSVEEDEDGGYSLPDPQRLLIMSNELASWVKGQVHGDWAATLADVFDGEGRYAVRDKVKGYNFGLNQHSLAVAFSVQPDAAHHLFDEMGRGLPGRFLVSVLPPQAKTLPEDFDPFNLPENFDLETFDPFNDTQPLGVRPIYLTTPHPFVLSSDAARANAGLKLAWDQRIGAQGALREYDYLSQLPKVRLRTAVLLAVLLDLGQGQGKREVPKSALIMADLLTSVSAENAHYAFSLAKRAERKMAAESATDRKMAESSAELTLAKEAALAVIDGEKLKRAGIGRMENRKPKYANYYADAVSELLAEGKIVAMNNNNNSTSYKRA